MKKYKTYKDSGIEWIGDIPLPWDLKRMKFSVNKHDDSVVNSSFLIAVENIESGTGKLVGLEKEQNFEGAVTGFRKGDVIFNKLRPYLAKVYHAEQDGGCYGELLILRGNDYVDNGYLFYLTFSKPFIDTVDSSTHGTKMPRANWENFIKQLHIPLPSLKEQTQIANYLDHKTTQIDDLISKKEKLIGLLKEERTVIINQAVTKGLDSTVPMQDSGIEWLGEIPEHWEVSRLKYYFDAVGGYAFSSNDFSDEGVQLVKIGNLYQNKLSLDRQPTFIPLEIAKNHTHYQARKNDILLSLTGTLGKRDYGYAILINEDLDLLVNQRVAKISAKLTMDIRFGINLFHCETYLNKLMSIPTGTKQGNLSCEDVLSIHMGIPPIDEQNDIAKYLESEFLKISDLEFNYLKEIELLKEYKTALISEVVTGKVDVRGEILN